MGRFTSRTADEYIDAVLASPGLVGFWPANDPSGLTIADWTRNKNHATKGSSAALAQRAFGALSSPLAKGDGTAAVPFNAGTAAVLDVADVFTLSAAISITTGNTCGLISRGGSTGYIRISGSKFNVLKAQVADIGSTTVNVNDGLLHVLHATKNGATVKLYVDGVDRTGSITNATCLSKPAVETYFGCDNGTAGTPGTAAEVLNGYAGMFAIWNRAITASEARAMTDIALGR